MTALLILIPLSLGMGMVGLGAFFWAMRHGQFDDPEGNAWRVIETLNPPESEGRTDHRMAPHPEDRNASGGL